MSRLSVAHKAKFSERGGNPRQSEELSKAVLNNIHQNRFIDKVCSLFHWSLFTSRKRCAFTLAEVLITLGIIGVVAAMTLPTLINKYHERDLVAKYKKVYSLLNQAYMRTIPEYGPANTWDSRNDTPLYEKMKPYFKLSADCPANSNGSARLKCVGTTEYYLYYKDLAGNVFSLATFYKWPSIRLVTGEFIVFPEPGAGGNFMVDLNGNAGPNQLGVDFHYFSFSADNNSRIIPGAGWEWGRSKSDQAKRCDRTKTDAWGPGSSCGYWIIKHSNMDYLHIPIEEVYEKW